MNINWNDTIQDDGYVHVFVDGSYAPQTGKAGIGIIIATKNHAKPITISASETTQESYKTELAALTRALEITKTRQRVKIYTDNKKLLKNVAPKFRNSQTPNLAKAFKEHNGKNVIVEYSHDKPNKERSAEKRYYMTLAHNAACDESEATNAKVPTPTIPTGNLAASTTTGMEIINNEAGEGNDSNPLPNPEAKRRSDPAP